MHSEALGVVEQLLGGILSFPPHLPPSLISDELQHRHRLLGLAPSRAADAQEAVDFLFTDVYSFGDAASDEVVRGLDGLRLQLERGGAMGSGVDAQTVVRAIVTSVAYQRPEPEILLAQIGLGRSEEARPSTTSHVRPLIFVMLRSETSLKAPSSSSAPALQGGFKFDGLQPSRNLPGSWHPTWQEAARGARSGEDMDMDLNSSSRQRGSTARVQGHRRDDEDDGSGQRGELIDNAEDFWAGVDDDEEPGGAGQAEHGEDDEERRRREEEAAEAAYWAAYDQVSGSPSAGAESGGGVEADLSLESVEEARKRKRARAQKEPVVGGPAAESTKAVREQAVKEMLKGAWKLAISGATDFDEDDFARIAREAVREATAEDHAKA